jgi:hypothetical protein
MMPSSYQGKRVSIHSRMSSPPSSVGEGRATKARMQ